MGLCPNCDDARIVAEASRRQTEVKITEQGGVMPAFTIICFDQVGEDGTFGLEDYVRGVDKLTMVERFATYQEAAEFVARNARKNS